MPGGNPKSWLLTCTEDTVYYVYDPLSSSPGSNEATITPFAAAPIRRVWSPSDQARLTSGQWGFGRQYSDSVDKDDDEVNWHVIPRAYPMLYFRARTVYAGSFEMRLSRFDNVMIWPRCGDNTNYFASSAAGNFVVSDVGLLWEELRAEQACELVLLSRADCYENFRLEWMLAGEGGHATAQEEVDGGLHLKPDRPVVWALLVVRQAAAGDRSNHGQVFWERRALGFIYQDRLGEFEGLGVREIVLA
ncbi:hypothetical protein B0T18DRAFT_420978 [Schizothecium vesticola]|uniref:Uncharacterized protein n=1 Tax=Schizothecium vesticola TaxID=314040 RepID=A0AA40EE06_9PEZI|nr:hypothetical protein B0T18DRAFT_420978 [Schizothecium vesticola]